MKTLNHDNRDAYLRWSEKYRKFIRTMHVSSMQDATIPSAIHLRYRNSRDGAWRKGVGYSLGAEFYHALHKEHAALGGTLKNFCLKRRFKSGEFSKDNVYFIRDGAHQTRGYQYFSKTHLNWIWTFDPIREIDEIFKELKLKSFSPAYRQKLMTMPGRIYNQMIADCLKYGIDMTITFTEFCAVWQPYWDQRDGHGTYRMLRTDEKRGFELGNVSIVQHGHNSVRSNARHYIVTHPDGRVEDVFNLTKFAHKHGLLQSGLGRVANGKAQHHHKFRAEHAVSQRKAHEALVRSEPDVWKRYQPTTAGE